MMQYFAGQFALREYHKNNGRKVRKHFCEHKGLTVISQDKVKQTVPYLWNNKGITLECNACGTLMYRPYIGQKEELADGYWRCPNGCNEEQ